MSYSEYTWQTGETITAEKLNNLEGGVQEALECCGGSALEHWLDGKAAGSVRSNTSAKEDANYSLGSCAVAEGGGTQASGAQSHAEGGGTIASGVQSHAEGGGTTASGVQSHTEGVGTTASGAQSHAEGGVTTASEAQSHAEGSGTRASGAQSHAEGGGTTASGAQSHAEGNGTQASGAQSHAEGEGTTANCKSQHVFGEYNIEDTGDSTTRGTYVEIVGNGTGLNAHSNARTLDWSGNESLQGSLTLGKGTADETTITAAQLKALIALLNS